MDILELPKEVKRFASRSFSDADKEILNMHSLGYEDFNNILNLHEKGYLFIKAKRTINHLRQTYNTIGVIKLHEYFGEMDTWPSSKKVSTRAKKILTSNLDESYLKHFDFALIDTQLGRELANTYGINTSYQSNIDKMLKSNQLSVFNKQTEIVKTSVQSIFAKNGKFKGQDISSHPIYIGMWFKAQKKKDIPTGLVGLIEVEFQTVALEQKSWNSY